MRQRSRGPSPPLRGSALKAGSGHPQPPRGTPKSPRAPPNPPGQPQAPGSAAVTQRELCKPHWGPAPPRCRNPPVPPPAPAPRIPTGAADPPSSPKPSCHCHHWSPSPSLCHPQPVWHRDRPLGTHPGALKDLGCPDRCPPMPTLRFQGREEVPKGLETPQVREDTQHPPSVTQEGRETPKSGWEFGGLPKSPQMGPTRATDTGGGSASSRMSLPRWQLSRFWGPAAQPGSALGTPTLRTPPRGLSLSPGDTMGSGRAGTEGVQLPPSVVLSGILSPPRSP